MSDLKPAAQAIVSSASGEVIEEATRDLRRYMADARWLGTQNRYLKRTVETLRDDLKSPPLSPRQQKHLRELIAASAITHCFDGWALLGRAMQASLIGDPHSCRHLAYYAELRGASSLLARSGVAVLNSQHLVVDGNREVHALSRSSFLDGQCGTHKAAWRLLHEWAQSTSAADLTARVITPEGVQISQWMDGTPTWARWRTTASGWLRGLGLDIRRMAEDQFARNEASYRPTTIRRDVPQATPASNMQFGAELWRLLEPGSTPFAALDHHLLRSSVERAFLGAHGAAASLQSQSFIDGVHALVDSQGLSELASLRISKFILRESGPDDIAVLAGALSRSSAGHPDHHFHAMARAGLLLRLATGAARDLLDRAGVDADLLRFWWSDLADARGIGVAISSPSDLADSWADIREAADALDAHAGDPQVPLSIVEMSGDGGALRALGKLELAGLVGLIA